MEAGAVARVAELFALLGEPSRLRIVLACLDGPRSVGEIAGTAALSASLTSHHLRLLRTGRLLRAERAGRHVLYALDDHHVRDAVRVMVDHVLEPHEHHGHGAGDDPAEAPDGADEVG